MEPLACERKIFESFFVCFFIAIDFISEDWIADRGEMDSDLVGTACEEIDFQKCVFIMEKSFNAKLCFSDFWIDWVDRRHFFPIIGISSDIGLDISLWSSHFSYHQCEIGLLDRSFCYLELEGMHGFIIFGDDDESTRILVESMNYPRTFDAIYDRSIWFTQSSIFSEYTSSLIL